MAVCISQLAPSSSSPKPQSRPSSHLPSPPLLSSRHPRPVPSPTNLSPSMNINPLIPPMPSSKLLIALPAPMLNILQPPHTKRNAAQAHDGAEAERPATDGRRSVTAPPRTDGLFDQTHNVYPPDTCFTLLTVRCWHAGHWIGTAVAPKGT